MADTVDHHRRLWRRQPGWHVAAPRVPGEGGESGDRSRGSAPSDVVTVADIEQALAAGRAASCERAATWPASRRQPLCASCGVTTADPTRCTVSLSTASFGTDPSPCWACSGRAVLALILKLPVVSSGGLNFRDRVSVRYTTYLPLLAISRPLLDRLRVIHGPIKRQLWMDLF